jgi:hypothetical protein
LLLIAALTPRLLSQQVKQGVSGVPPLLAASIREQFTRLRDGDRCVCLLAASVLPLRFSLCRRVVRILMLCMLAAVSLRWLRRFHARVGWLRSPRPSFALLLCSSASRFYYQAPGLFSSGELDEFQRTSLGSLIRAFPF